MPLRPADPTYERLVDSEFSSSEDGFELSHLDRGSQSFAAERRLHWLSRLLNFGKSVLGIGRCRARRLRQKNASTSYRHSDRLHLRRIKFFARVGLSFFLIWLVLTPILRPSYNSPPDRYASLRQHVIASSESGRGNPRQEKVFIAASIFDLTGDLATGAWSNSIIELIDLLGPENTFLSVYENDAGQRAKDALATMEQRVKCRHKFNFDDHLDLADLPKIVLPDGSERVKRIEYLAEVRNRALKPLETSDVKFDKLLSLNDVIFDPVDALQLLFSTKTDLDGQTNYRAACAIDFINPVKFYDTFATRDVDGYSMGVPFYPWFTSSGSGRSRDEVLAQKDSIMVKSCWGGMVAFDARFFQFETSKSLPVTALDPSQVQPNGFRFRAESDLYWDSSECCLIHADLQNPGDDTGIYMNPYIRVAYDVKTHSWLSFTRRFERLYVPIHWTVNYLVGLPWHNPRRAETPGSHVKEQVWIPDESSNAGSFQSVDRTAGHAGFCGRRALQVMLEHPTPGHRPYELLPLPD